MITQHKRKRTQAVILEWLGPMLRHEAQEPGAEGHWGRDTLYTLGFAATLALMYSLTAYFLTEARPSSVILNGMNAYPSHGMPI